jgi:hypothetical protein
MKLYFLQDGLAFLALDVEVHKVRFIGVHQLAEQNHGRMEMNLVVSAVQYARNVAFISQSL